MKKFEYFKTVKISSDHKIMREMNELGLKGWELMAVNNDKTSDLLIFYYKREIIE